MQVPLLAAVFGYPLVGPAVISGSMLQQSEVITSAPDMAANYYHTGPAVGTCFGACKQAQ